MKNYLLLFTILAFISFAQGQNKADDYYEAGYYKEASLIYEKELNTRKGPSDAVQLKLADCYFQMKDRKSTRLNSSHVRISYAVFCLKKKTKNNKITKTTQK